MVLDLFLTRIWDFGPIWDTLGHSHFTSQDILIISTFQLEHSFMLKSYRVGGGWVVAYKILVSAPVPIWIGIWGLGLGLDNFEYLQIA